MTATSRVEGGAAVDDGDELRRELGESARAALRATSGSAQVRALADTADGFDESLWAQFASLGWTGIEIAEDSGGAGGSFGDLAVILVEMGRQLCSNGFGATSVLGAGAVLAAGEQARSSQWLSELAAGNLRAAAVVAGTGTGTLTASRGGDGWTVSGAAPCVADLGSAQLLILPVIENDQTPVVFAITTDALTFADAPMLDMTRRFADLEVKDLNVGADSVLAQGPDAGHLIADLLNRAALATACDAFGAAERALHLTAEYAKERVQFDRPIGSFQAVKHRCADMYIAVATARSALEDAIDAYDADASTAAVAVSRAKAYVCDAAAQVVEDAVEMHGGIGFTWEHDMHLFVKRVRLDQALYGDSRWHRRRVAALTLG